MHPNWADMTEEDSNAGSRFEGSGFRLESLWGLGLRVVCLGFGVLGFVVKCLGLKIWGSEFEA